MLDDADVKKGAAVLWTGFRDKAPQTPLSVTFPQADITDAYRIQEHFVNDRLDEGHRIRGYKVGLTSKPMQEQAGIKEPDFGALLDFFFVPEASTLNTADFVDPAIEIELAFVMKEPLRGPGINTADVIRATDFILPAIEVVDFRLARKGRREGSGIFDTVADLASCGAVVLGGNPMRLQDINIAQVGGACVRNGEIEKVGVASQVLGNPINAIAWLANKLGEMGDITFEPGHTILSGSFIAIVPAAAGDHFVARFDNDFGNVELTFE